jgi:hypothetical protein
MENTEKLADTLRLEPTFEKAEPCYVSIYRHQRCYGGPEEGGWWYDGYELEGGVPFASRTAAENYLAKKQEEIAQRNRDEAPIRDRALALLPDEESAYCGEGYIPKVWSDGGKITILIETILGEQDNSRSPRPHYE